MDEGVSPSASQNRKVSKPSLGVRVLRTLFDNSPPTYTTTKSQPSGAAAAQARERRRLQELQKAEQLREAQQQLQAQAHKGQKNDKSRPPTHTSKVRNEGGRGREVGSKEFDNINVIENLAEKNGRFPPGLTKGFGGGGQGSHLSNSDSKSSLVSNGNRPSLDSFDDDVAAQSSLSTESEYDSSSFYRDSSYQEREVRSMNRSAVRNMEEEYDLSSGHVDDSLLLGDAEKELDSAQKLAFLKQEIERLRLENLVLRQRGTVNNNHHTHQNHKDSDVSRTSSITEVGNAEEAAEGWIPYAQYAPPGVHSASVALFHGPEPSGDRSRRDEMAWHPPRQQYFPGEHAARGVNGRGGGGGGGPGSSSETVSMVTDGSRVSSRHNSGLLIDMEPQSGLTSRRNSGVRSDHDEYSSMSWDGYGSRHNSGPMVVDRQELYGLTNNSVQSTVNSGTNSGIEADDMSRGSIPPTPLGGNSRDNSRHNSEMHVDRDGRNLPSGLMSPRVSLESNPVNSFKTVEETFTTHRLITRGRHHHVEPESWNNIISKTIGTKYEDEYQNSSSPANQGMHNNSNHETNYHVEAPTRASPSNSPRIVPQFRTLENYEVPTRATTPPPNFLVYGHDNERSFGSQNAPTTSTAARKVSTPPRSRSSSHELDSTNSSMFSYRIPSIITVPRSRITHSQVEAEDPNLSEILQQQNVGFSLSMENDHITSITRSRSTHSQMSTEDAGTPSSTAANQHQSTLERLMISKQRRQNMSSNAMSVNASPDHQYSRNSRQLHNKSPHRRSGDSTSPRPI